MKTYTHEMVFYTGPTNPIDWATVDMATEVETVGYVEHVCIGALIELGYWLSEELPEKIAGKFVWDVRTQLFGNEAREARMVVVASDHERPEGYFIL